LANSLIDRGELDEAEKHLSYVLEKRPNSLEALLIMMKVAERKDRKSELKKIYEKIHALDPKNETIVYNLGVLEYEDGRYEKSLPYFKQYLKSHPNESNLREILFDIYKRTNNRKMALEEALVLLELKPENMDTYHFVAESFIKKEDYKKLIPLTEKGLKINPEATELREYLLLSYLKTGNDKGAITQMKETLKRNPKNIELWLHVARLLEKNERYDEASEAYKNVIDLSPGHEEAEEAYLRLRLKGVRGERKT
jgi:tetratricopeptide (TPR) repeat protein